MYALLYGCESWYTNNLKWLDSAVLGCLKVMLGVRSQTCSDLIYIETGITPITTEISKMRRREDFTETPLGRALHMAADVKSPMGLYYRNLLRDCDHQSDPAGLESSRIKHRVLNSTATRMVTYSELNEHLDVHPIYTNTNTINEICRISFSRMRLSSHYLKVETGRWSRIPREHRKCSCSDSIQSEEHVLIHCPETADLRAQYPLDYTNIRVFMSCTDNVALTDYCHRVLHKMTAKDDP